MSAVDWVSVSKAARAAAADAIAGCRRHCPSAHYVHRQVEILAIDENHERIGDQLDFLLLKELSGKRLAQVVRDHAPAQYSYICVQGGIDAYDSFQDFMDDYDYEPMVECWEVNSTDDFPTASERIPLEECNTRTSGLSVATRIEQQTVRQRSTGTHGSQPSGEDFHKVKRAALEALDRSAQVVAKAVRNG